MAQLLTLVAADGGLNNFAGAPVGLTRRPRRRPRRCASSASRCPTTFAAVAAVAGAPAGRLPRPARRRRSPTCSPRPPRSTRWSGCTPTSRRVKEPCLDFIDSLWTNRGGFYGHWEDDILDCEYTLLWLARARPPEPVMTGRRHLGSPPRRAPAPVPRRSTGTRPPVRRCCGRGPQAGHWEGPAVDAARSRPPPPSSLSRRPSDTTPESSHTGSTPDRTTPESSAARSAARRGVARRRTPNADGGWGDTPDSRSNISTTALSWGALTWRRSTPAHRRRGAAGRSVARRTSPAASTAARCGGRSTARYGTDRTFSVPILTRPGDRRAPGAMPGGTSRSCRSSWRRPRIAVRVAAAAGGELRAAGAHRHRPGAAPARGRRATRSTRLARTATRRRTLRDAARDPADDRRLPRSDAAHQLRRDEPRSPPGQRDHRGRARGRRLPSPLRPRGRQLADRHQPGDVGDDAVDQRARRGRAADVVARRRRARDAAASGSSASSIASSIPTRTPRRAAGRGPISPAACRTPTTRPARSSRWRISGPAGTRRPTRASATRRRPASAGCSTCRTATAACRRSAAAGPACRSTAAAPS